MGSKKSVTVGYRYYLGLHFGLCHGPVDAVQKVVVGERVAWVGHQDASGSVAINAPDLFGGDKREGGVVGQLDVLMGESTQVENSYLQSKLGAAIPAFRGILSAVWRGGQVTANNPYLKPWAFTVRRILQGWTGGSAWYPSKAIIRTVSDIVTEEFSVAFPVLTQGVDALYPAPGQTYPIPVVMGPFAEARRVVIGNSAGAGNFNVDDYFVVNGEVFNPAGSAGTPVPAGTDLGMLAPGETMTFSVKNTVNPYCSGYGTITAFVAEGVDMNPAHMIYQCLTDKAWGMGYPVTAIDSASFTAAADTLYAEGFGLSMLWNQQEIIEQFVGVILDHIGGILYVRPETSTFALKLIRADYDRGTLPLYGPATLVAAENYQRQGWGETVNEITVVYTHANTSKDIPVTVQDPANIAVQGGVVAQTRNYPGIRSPLIAQRVALRDLQAGSTPLASIKLTATRSAWQVFPGDVFRLTWPEYDIDDVVYRALNVNRGTLTDGQIIIDAVEDVFGLPENTYLAEQPGGWVDPSNPPAVALYRKVIEAPYWDLARNLAAADLDYVDALSGYLETLAVRPSGDAINYGIQAKVGAAAYEAAGNGDFCPSAAVVGALTKTTTAITLDNGIDLDLIAAGGYAIIGDEYVLVSAIDANASTATISRGLLDTVPAEHAAGARIWFADGDQGFSSIEYADGEVVDVKLLPVTGRGELDIAMAPVDSLTMDQRQYRPYPPAKVRFNTFEWPATLESAADVVLTWAHRDRLAQTAYLVEQDESSIGPEAGVTYSVEVADEALAVLHSATGISGTTATVPASSLTAGLLRFRLWSVRGGLASWQQHEHWAFWGELRVTEDGESRLTESGDFRVTD